MIDLIYRICENRNGTHCGNNRPEWFSKETCLYSFLNAVKNANGLIGELIFIHDGPKGPLFDIIKQYHYIKINHGNYIGSLMEAYNIALSLSNDLYFVEDDYLHMPQSIVKLTKSLSLLQLCNGYDHPHRYYGTDDIHYDMKIIFDKESNHHWRTSESTCHTFAITRNLFNSEKNIFLNHQCVCNDRLLFRTLHHKGIPLWTSIPGLTTQVDPYLSPGIDWETFNRSI